MSNPVAERRPPVRMTVRALVMDPVSNMPVVILQDADQSSFLPIWIGVCEANAISLVLEGVLTPRPMTHDLIRGLLGATGYSVDHVLIHSLSESVFLASIHLVNGAGDSREVDSRPSDALALALRTNSAILVDPEVLARAVVAEPSQDEAIRSILERLRPEDLGEYEM
jgi:bifunctional DNase/RNase